jgi:hypothetical protein
VKRRRTLTSSTVWGEHSVREPRVRMHGVSRTLHEHKLGEEKQRKAITSAGGTTAQAAVLRKEWVTAHVSL